MTRDQLVETIAAAVRDADGCGLTVDRRTVFCDDSRVSGDMRDAVCKCRETARAALETIRGSGLAVVSYECLPIILAHGWAAINAGRTQPVDMAPGPALREAYPAMVAAADILRVDARPKAG